MNNENDPFGLEPWEPEGEPGNRDREQREGRDRRERSAERGVLRDHRFGDQVADDEQYDKVEGGHLGELTLPQDPQHAHQKEEHEDRVDDGNYQGITHAVTDRSTAGAPSTIQRSVTAFVLAAASSASGPRGGRRADRRPRANFRRTAPSARRGRDRS
nr:hypothetical protein [Nocardioides silvaticus]